MKKLLCKAMILIYDLLSKYGRKSIETDKPNVLLVFAGVIGDSVLFCDALRGYAQLFLSEGYRVTIYAPNTAALIFEEYTLGFDIVGINFKKLNTDYQYHKQVIKKMASQEYQYAINPFVVRSNESDSLMINCKAKRKIQAICQDRPSMRWWEKLVNMQCGQILEVPNGLMELQRNAWVLNELGLKTFKAKLPLLPIKGNISKIVNCDRYCVMAVGASTACKRWPAKKFAEVANEIMKKFNMPIVVCGGKEEINSFAEMQRYLNQPEQVLNYMGKTSIPELVDLIRGAQMLIGNDSASVHIAAAVRTKSVCVVGGWEHGRVHPYKLDLLEEKDCIPIAVFHRMDCFNCGKIGLGWNNEVCQKFISNGENYPCVECISSEEVAKIACDSLQMNRDKKEVVRNEFD